MDRLINNNAERVDGHITGIEIELDLSRPYNDKKYKLPEERPNPSKAFQIMPSLKAKST